MKQSRVLSGKNIRCADCLVMNARINRSFIAGFFNTAKRPDPHPWLTT